MGMYCEVSAASRDDLARFSADMLQDGLLTNASPDCRVSLEKAWHGLHYLLTGEVWGGDGPLAFLLAGGENLGDDESPLRWFTPEETAQIHRALTRVSDDQLWSRFDPDAMGEKDVYPGIWDEPEDDLKSEYMGYFHALKSVVAAAADAGQGLLVSIG